ncbi:hypothetical protein B566_EDAN016291 [Ephemera danica]|nr:hypothetical protein B566_EDAN016291 [Ephemera danica]
MDIQEVSSTVSQLIVSTRDETMWPKFTEKLRKLVGPVKAPRGKGDPEGSVEAVGLMYGGGVYLEATTSCRLKTSPGRSPSQKQVVQSDEEEEEEEEERKKKEKRKKATTFMKSPGRQPPTFDVSEQSYDDDVEEEAQAFAATANRLTRRRSRSADRAPTGRVNTRARAASASSSRQRSQVRK